jgi:hypothetical protein
MEEAMVEEAVVKVVPERKPIMVETIAHKAVTVETIMITVETIVGKAITRETRATEPRWSARSAEMHAASRAYIGRAAADSTPTGHAAAAGRSSATGHTATASHSAAPAAHSTTPATVLSECR